MGPGIIPPLCLNAGKARWLRALVCAVLAAVVATIPGQASAQAVPKRATAQTQAVLLTQGNIVKSADMDFGTIAPGAAGTVVISPQSTATCTASAPLIRTGPCRAASFDILYLNNKHVFLRDGNNGLITLSGPSGATMQVTNLTLGAVGLSTKQTAGGWDFGKWKVSDPNGFAQIFIGGTLNVSATQTPGTYTGTMTIEVQMN